MATRMSPRPSRRRWSAVLTEERARGLDVLVTAVAVTGAMVLQARWLAVVAGVWSVVALRQGWVAVRSFRRGR
ncbi:hypothetical protein OG568_08600 [Streptomyces sp. NBC_01450]|uniref:hypothetical protein n=1 Tax=Streptomyces sp. NBC_01450 TaxID=2903871 RepID=UPI002E35EC5E|nr:hypothetical protein [Streptomyces sp. NBC_01450]